MMAQAWLRLMVLLCTMVTVTMSYRFGLGKFDITGPAADVNMMGYANVRQTAGGIHLRLFSRAFIIQEDKTRPVLIINLDAGMVSHIIKYSVLEKLNVLFPQQFNQDNVLISATHTHSGPGGYFQSFLYSITSFGFVEESFDALVTGIVQSVEQAYENMVDGNILIVQGDVYNASINRSPAAYLQNPSSERAQYPTDVDTVMTLLKFVSATGEPMGMLNWFAVHPVSMNESNRLISSDNKGLASFLFEQRMNMNRSVDLPPFVAAFGQGNEGDVSPNTAGPRCIDTGLPCAFVHSSCNGYAEKCIAFGPGVDMFDSTKIIALRQMTTAMELFEKAEEKLSGPVAFVHQYVNMTDVEVDFQHYRGRTCKPAMGYSFAAGTTDGPGDFDFIQGLKNGTLFWNFVRNLLRKPSEELIRCHEPKPILLATGEMRQPYQWQPEVVPTQVIRLGRLLLIALPGEFTTMSGRRIREAVQNVTSNWLSQYQPAIHPKVKLLSSFKVVLVGLSNMYSSYIATPEEYMLQRYESASTIYGPLTLPAYIQQFVSLADALLKNKQLPPGPKPPYFKEKLVSFLPKVLFDTPPFGTWFGDVNIQPRSVYSSVDDIVHVQFVGASPRNNIRLNGTFVTVERLDEANSKWVVKYTDANWETKFHWSRSNIVTWILGHSVVDIDWEVKNIDGNCEPGEYRIRYFGTAKPIFTGQYLEFTGTSNTFSVQCQ